MPVRIVVEPVAAVSPEFDQMLVVRSACVYKTPVSITATVTEALPVVTSQASGTSMSASFAASRPQSSPNRGSFGVVEMR